MSAGTPVVWLVSALLVVALAGNVYFGYTTLAGRSTQAMSTGTAGATVSSGDRQITVTSEGSVDAVPDIAYLTAGVETRAATAHEAMDLNATTMQRVLDAVGQAGISPDQIRTEAVNLYPIVGQTPGEPGLPEAVRSYAASNSVTMTITDLSRAGAILDVAIQAGATTSNGMHFAVRHERQLRDQALVQATAAARARAEIVAQQLGVRLGALTNLTEETTAVGSLATGMGGAGAVPIQPGQLTFSTRVQASYSYEP